MSSDEPPAYSSADPPPYPTSLPPSFPVGLGTTEPLVNTTLLKAHLAVLKAFSELHKQVREADNVGTVPLEAEQKWPIFLARALDRFWSWVDKVVRPLVGSGSRRIDLPEANIPPVDVLCVWHAYMLNPRNYFEDGLRSTPLLQLGSFPLMAAVQLLDSPSPEQIASWESVTGSPFFPVLSTSSKDMKRLDCPKCSAHGVEVPWVTADGKGWAQPEATARCYGCGQTFNKEALGVLQLATDMVNCISPKGTVPAGFTEFLPTLTTSNTPITGVRGIILDPPTGIPSPARAKMMLERFMRFYLIVLASQPKTPQQIAHEAQWQMAGIESRCRMGMKMFSPQNPTPRLWKRIFSAYTHGDPASMELVGAVLRQGSFIQKMVDLGWTDPNRFTTGREEPLVRAVARYHAFLDLMSSSPASFFVPTLDIDLAWHTHQLLGHKYRNDTITLLKRTPDHDDKVEEGALSTSFDVTARAWRARFGVPYSVCGCLPPDASLGDKFTKLTSRLRRTASSPALSNPRPDLLSTSDYDAEPTHASEHNAVILAGHKDSERRRAHREKAWTSRVAKARKDVEKGKADPWTELAVKRVEDHRRRTGETYVPYWGIMPLGFYGYGMYTGGVIYGYGGYGACAVGAGAYCGGGGGGAACGGGGGCGGGGCGGGGCGGGGCGGGGGGCGGGGGGGGCGGS